MTREEIIMELEKIRERRYVDYTVQSQHALDMAIEALEMDNSLERLREIVHEQDEIVRILEEERPNERPKGHWIYEEGTYKLINLWQCSECYEVVDEKTNYCPECGSDMRGDEQ